jgi:hypothetical protein
MITAKIIVYKAGISVQNIFSGKTKNAESYSNSSSLLKYSQLKLLLKNKLAESDILAW